MPIVRSRDDAGAAEALGGILLLGVVVAVVAAVAVTMASSASTSAPLPQITIAPTVGTAGTPVAVVHSGGETVDLADVRFFVEVGTSVEAYAPTQGATGLWRMGEALEFAIPALPAGLGANVHVVHAVRGELVASAPVARYDPSGLAPPPGFSVAVELDGSTATPTVVRPANVLVEATVTHPNGRKMVHTVHADLTEIDGPPYFPLNDEGMDGDAIAGDGVWSAIVTVGLGSPGGTRTIPVAAEDLEGRVATGTASVNVV